MADYKATENFYDGTYSSLDSTWGNFTGYREATPSTIGFPGSPFTADQLGEAVKSIKSGAKVFEVTFLGPPTGDKDQTAPVQHLKEIRALTKLTGVSPSVHGPLVDAAGFDGGRGWLGEEKIKENKRRMWDAIQRAHVVDPDSNIPVVFHTSNGTPGRVYKPGDVSKGEDRFRLEQTAAVNQETGQLAPLKREKAIYPGVSPEALRKGGIEQDPIERIDSLNNSQWENKITELATFNQSADAIINSSEISLFLTEFKKAGISEAAGIKLDKDGKRKVFDPQTGEFTSSLQLMGPQAQTVKTLQGANNFLRNIQIGFRSAFEEAYKYANSEEQKKELEKLSLEYGQGMGQIQAIKKETGMDYLIMEPKIKRDILNNSINRLHEITSLNEDENFGAPKVYKEVENFAMDKATTTFAEVASDAYDTYKDGKGIPVLAIENIYREAGAFTRGEDMKKFIEDTREKFKDHLMSKHKLKEKAADKIAKRQIGITWDVGHINMLKKDGFTDEDIADQVREITKDPSMVKHLHITDNFGFSDSHLPPGMGNVPIKKQLEVLEKTGRVHEMKKIMEAGGFIEQFKASPAPLSFSAFGSGIYPSVGGDPDMFIHRNYSAGFGLSNPQVHQSLYGSNFTNLPTDLGGQIAGMSRLSGNKME